ncbi:hypothetical protein ACGFY7_14315 [Streptomyces prunicolor]|uniref:hypothetical protein n=1 Tax=Streptomyces prunicolor TaxID=67348 RepID=UPI00371636B7
MSSPEHVVDELVRAKGLGHVGTMVYGRSGDRFLDDPPVFESACVCRCSKRIVWLSNARKSMFVGVDIGAGA